MTKNTYRERFVKIMSGKRLVLYGAGAGMDLYFALYRNRYSIKAVIDNNPNKIGCPVCRFGQRAWKYTSDYMTIKSGSELLQMDLSDAVILITGMRRGEEIAEQLKEQDVLDFYMLSDMVDESWRDIALSGDDIPGKDEKFEAWCDRQPIEKKRIVCFSFPDFADHEKYIALALKKLQPDSELIFFSDIDYSKQWPGIRFVQRENWRNVEYLKRTARAILFNSDIPLDTKREGQVFIETKHWSSVTLKKFFLDADTFIDDIEFHQRMVKGFRLLDYIITGSDFDTRTCRSGFAFSGPVWQIGSPRSDVLFKREEFISQIRNIYGLPSDVKIMLYAPTYRFVKGDEHHKHESREIALDYEAVVKALRERFGGEWVIMLRLHPTVAKESKKMQLPDFVIDASEYMDSGELLAACDGMISDYSSLMFEPSFIYLPVFLFATDRESYAKEYEFLIDYDELPYPIAESNEELVNNILEFDKEKYAALVDDFLEKYGVHEDGHASERAAKLISELMR